MRCLSQHVFYVGNRLLSNQSEPVHNLGVLLASFCPRILIKALETCNLIIVSSKDVRLSGFF